MNKNKIVVLVGVLAAIGIFFVFDLGRWLSFRRGPRIGPKAAAAIQDPGADSCETAPPFRTRRGLGSAYDETLGV